MSLILIAESCCRHTKYPVHLGNWGEDMDEYADFLSDALIATKGSKVPKRDMHDAFLSWGRANGIEPLSKREFGTLLKHAGYSEIRSKKTRYWNDVALSLEFEGADYV